MRYRAKKKICELRDNIGEMLQEFTNDFIIELTLQLLTGEKQSIGGNVSVEARADISAGGFWCRGQRTFFDVRIFHPNAQHHENKTLTRCYEMNEHEKKRDYSSRILNADNRSYGKQVIVSDDLTKTKRRT